MKVAYNRNKTTSTTIQFYDSNSKIDTDAYNLAKNYYLNMPQQRQAE
jgi:hypothetical protein